MTRLKEGMSGRIPISAGSAKSGRSRELNIMQIIGHTCDKAYASYISLGRSLNNALMESTTT